MDTRFLEEDKTAFLGKRNFIDDFVLPDYDAFNIRNIKSLIGKIYGVGSIVSSALPGDSVDDFGGVEKVFLVIMDGFGYNRFLTHIKHHDGVFSELTRRGVLKPFTSPFPATTATSLTSIFTGLTPAEHGVIGYHMFSPEYGCVFNTLDMRPVYGYNSEFQIAKYLARKIKPWAPDLEEHGVRTLISTKGSIIGSGLSRVIHAGQDLMPYLLESEMFVKCRRALEQPDPIFLTLYYSGIDTLEHKYGPYSDEVSNEIQLFEFLLQNFFSKLSAATKKETLIILTSDHGVCETKRTLYVKDYPEIANNLLLPPVGDSRSGFLFSKLGQKEKLENAFGRTLEGFRVVANDDLIESGAFGRIADSTALHPAIGDFAALSRGPNGLSYPYFEDDRDREQNGGHGGMTAEEVLVPLLSIRLSKV